MRRQSKALEPVVLHRLARGPVSELRHGHTQGCRQETFQGLQEVLHQSCAVGYVPSCCEETTQATEPSSLTMQIGDQGHFYAGSSSSNGDSKASTSASAVVFIEDTHKAGGGALVVHHGRLESGDLHVGQMASYIPHAYELSDLLINVWPLLQFTCLSIHEGLFGSAQWRVQREMKLQGE